MKKTYSYGDMVYLKKTGIWGEDTDKVEELMIAQVGVDVVCLVSTSDGNRWKDPIEVANAKTITQEEMNKLIGNSFTKGYVTLFSKEEYKRLKTNKTYKVGNKIYLKYLDNDVINEYIIVQTGYNEICLIDSITYDRWEKPVKVNNSMAITQEELEDIVGEEVELVSKEEYEKWMSE